MPSAIGAVVDGVSIDLQTPLSGQRSPVRAVVPMGLRARAEVPYIVDIPLNHYDIVRIYLYETAVKPLRYNFVWLDLTILDEPVN